MILKKLPEKLKYTKLYFFLLSCMGVKLGHIKGRTDRGSLIAVLNGILGPMILDVTRGLTTLRNELHNLYAPPNIISRNKSRKMRWVGYFKCMGGKTNALKKFGSEPKDKKIALKT
jgi:hypothetical protein